MLSLPVFPANQHILIPTSAPRKKSKANDTPVSDPVSDPVSESTTEIDNGLEVGWLVSPHGLSGCSTNHSLTHYHRTAAVRRECQTVWKIQTRLQFRAQINAGQHYYSLLLAICFRFVYNCQSIDGVVEK